MSEKPEALRLAHELDAYHAAPHHKEAAAELRRQHAENERLMTRLVEAKDKALRYDLDAAGISNREKEALELVELRAENERLRDELLEAEKLAFELSIKSTELHKEIHAALQREV